MKNKRLKKSVERIEEVTDSEGKHKKDQVY